MDYARDDCSTVLNGELAVATAPNTVEEIQRRMAEIRRELHKDVRGVVANAEAVTDWRRYLTKYPWAALGTAFAIGYVVVPRRTRVSVEAVPKAAAKEIRAAIETIREEQQPRRSAWKGVLGSVWALAGPVAIRAAQSYAAQFLESQLQQYNFGSPAESTPPGANPGREWGQ